MLLQKQVHSYHLVDPSPWPFITAFGAFTMVVGFANYMHFYSKGFMFLLIGFILVNIASFSWWRDIIREASYEGLHLLRVLVSLKGGMALFIVSEVMLFFAFFWGFFHSSLNPVPEIGCIWPPIGLTPISAWGIPLLNTIILLTSGAVLTWGHYALISGSFTEASYGIGATILLATIFTLLQVYEYQHATFTISSGVFGSTFYMATGLHGFHVLVGTLYILYSGVRMFYTHYSRNHHIGFEFAIWYWHFVDVVWIFLFLTIYWWGGSLVPVM